MKQDYPELEIRDLPQAPHWRKAIGVGVVMLGLAIGTGELILWPHLVTKFGLGILWGALLGITFQYFINQEVARYTLATGESFFTASARLFKWSIFLWVFLAIILYVWPGWASAIGTTLAALFGFGNHIFWAYTALLMVLVITFLGKFAYGALEKILMVTVPIFFVLLIVVSFLNLRADHLLEALRGLLNFGYIPQDMDLNIFFGAVVFAGTGGLLNLCVSLWSRDKQLGMGKYMGRIMNPITGEPESVRVTGFTFRPDEESVNKWKKWMRIVRIDQGFIFWFLGLLTLVLLSLNAHVALSPRGLVPDGLSVAVVQAEIFAEQWGMLGYKLFLAMASLMLFGAMWAIISAFARIVSDIVYVNSCAGPYQKLFSRFQSVSIHKLYYGLILFLVTIQLVLIPFKPPLFYLVISSVLGGISMAIYVPFLLYINNRRLPQALRPGIITNSMLLLAFIFYAGFSAKIFMNIFL